MDEPCQARRDNFDYCVVHGGHIGPARDRCDRAARSEPGAEGPVMVADNDWAKRLLKAEFENHCGDATCQTRRTAAAVAVLTGWKEHTDLAWAVEVFEVEIGTRDPALVGSEPTNIPSRGAIEAEAFERGRLAATPAADRPPMHSDHSAEYWSMRAARAEEALEEALTAADSRGLDVELLGFTDLLDIGSALLAHYPPDTIVCSHSVKADIGAQTAAGIADLIASCRAALTDADPAS